MIFIATKRIELAKELKRRLNEAGSEVIVINVDDRNILKEIYNPKITAIIADAEFPGIPAGVCVDILNSFGGRIPVVVLKEPKEISSHDVLSTLQISEQVTIVDPEEREDILHTLSLFGRHSRVENKNNCQAIPYYNVQIPMAILKDNGGLGILTIDASSFSKIGLEYGMDVYNKLKTTFQELLFDMWGRAGSFRSTDIICRKSMNSNIYYIFLNRSRQSGSLPNPGALEMIADRVGMKIHNALWHEVFSNGRGKIPACVRSIPLAGIGFFGVLNNPCIDPQEIIEYGLEASRKVSQSQLVRVKERQRELMQTLIQSEDLLKPNYQAVFELKGLSRKMVDEAQSSKSIRPLKSLLYGFESLIRVDAKKVSQTLEEASSVVGLEPQFLRPDILFSMAKSSKVALELDQACLRHATQHSRDLPGVLMVNILPRNLYYIDRLSHLFDQSKNIMFEVSESEAINNFDLLLKSCKFLQERSMGIAADDFGKGFSSLERIIKIRPSLIKFDRSMIQNIDRDPIKQAYVKGMVAAGKIINTTILAEGVETWEEAKVLQEMGIDLVQGFLLHKPQDAYTVLSQLDIKPLSVVA